MIMFQYFFFVFNFNQFYFLILFIFIEYFIRLDIVIMEPKFKQIASFKETECIDIRTTEKAVNSALNCLLGNVA